MQKRLWIKFVWVFAGKKPPGKPSAPMRKNEVKFRIYGTDREKLNKVRKESLIVSPIDMFCVVKHVISVPTW